MKTGLGKSTLLISLSFAVVGFSGCKTTPFCEPRGACGGDLMQGAFDFYKMDGIPDKSWTVTADNACQDQLELPPASVSLVRQPPSVANVRPPDPETADWCYGLVINADGTIHQFLPYAPPLPIKVAQITMSDDYDKATNRGTYVLETTVDQERTLSFSETCLTGQGLRLTCPALGRALGQFLAAEANIYSMRCWNPPDPSTGGCDCEFEESFIGGPTGRWAQQPNGTQIVFFDNTTYAPAATADYCYNANGTS